MIADDYRHCEALVRETDKDRFLSALLAPAARRDALFALYAFNVEMARIPIAAPEPFAAAIRLQWWREALLGERSGEAAANPVSAALNDALASARVSPAPLIAQLETRRAIVFGEPETDTDTAVFLVAAQLMGATGDQVAAAAEQAGHAYALATHDPSPDPTHAGQAWESYAAFRALAGHLPKAALPAFLPAALVPLLLRRPQAPQWRRQLALLRTVWFGFPPASP